MSRFDYSTITEEWLQLVKRNLEEYNRFFPPDTFAQALGCLLKDNESFTTEITSDMSLYRAKIYREKEDNEEKTVEYQGYGPKGSGVPQEKWVGEGRMNPSGIKILYLATGKTTCVKEIGAATGEKVSIGVFHSLKKLKVADFQNIRVSASGKRILINWIRELLSRGYGGKDYVITQYLAMLFKHLNIDGIKYRSKYATTNDVRKGNNIAVFDAGKCTCVSSSIYKVKSISLGLDPKDS